MIDQWKKRQLYDRKHRDRNFFKKVLKVYLQEIGTIHDVRIDINLFDLILLAHQPYDFAHKNKSIAFSISVKSSRFALLVLIERLELRVAACCPTWLSSLIVTAC